MGDGLVPLGCVLMAEQLQSDLEAAKAEVTEASAAQQKSKVQKGRFGRNFIIATGEFSAQSTATLIV